MSRHNCSISGGCRCEQPVCVCRHPRSSARPTVCSPFQWQSLPTLRLCLLSLVLPFQLTVTTPEPNTESSRNAVTVEYRRDLSVQFCVPIRCLRTRNCVTDSERNTPRRKNSSKFCFFSHSKEPGAFSVVRSLLLTFIVFHTFTVRFSIFF